MKNSRAIAATQLAKTFAKGQAFDGSVLNQELINNRDLGLVKEICFGTLRHYHLLAALVNPLLKKPLAKKDSDIYALLLAGLYQMRFMQTPKHAAINTSVEACRSLGKVWAKGLINAVLRNLVRQNKHQPDQFDSIPLAARHSQPEWLFDQLQRDWPEHAQQIIDYNNTAPPMSLRVNTQLTNPQDYLARLDEQGIAASINPACNSSITLEKAVDVNQLPGFSEGDVSIQDAGAQLVGPLLNLSAGQSLLDACAAPGGKSIHALQLHPEINLTALDHQASRLSKLEQDLQRCKLSAKVICADAGEPQRWWDRQLFNAILVDAPCSGTGIISHHPDIKLLRKASDLAGFAKQQSRLLNALWSLLAPGGNLLYCTCSVMPEENSQVVSTFIKQHTDASLDPLDIKHTIDTGWGYQLLPNKGENGGFFYARLSKSN